MKEQSPHIYLSSKRSLFVGRFNDVLSQENGLSTLLISLEGPIELIDFLPEGADQSDHSAHVSGNLLCKTVMVPSGSKVSVDTKGQLVAFCFLDYFGADISLLSELMTPCHNRVSSDVCYVGMQNGHAMEAELQALIAQDVSADAVMALLDNWLGSTPCDEWVIDHRVEDAISYIKANHDRNLSAEDIAGFVGLSVPRLVQLFKKGTGLPLRRFRLVHRVFMTLLYLAENYPLTDAVMMSGFSDYAHFSRRFKELSGIAPSALLSARQDLVIKVDSALCYELSSAKLVAS